MAQAHGKMWSKARRGSCARIKARSSHIMMAVAVAFFGAPALADDSNDDGTGTAIEYPGTAHSGNWGKVDHSGDTYEFGLSGLGLSSSSLPVLNFKTFISTQGTYTDTIITGVADGLISETSNDAVNGKQLYEVDSMARKGWNLSAQGGAATKVGPGDTVDLSNSDGNLVIEKEVQEGVSTVTFDLADDITIGNSLTVGKIRIDSNGINAGGTRIQNLAQGLAPTDAVNLSQLQAVEQSISDRSVKYDLDTSGGVDKTRVTLEGAPSDDGGRTNGTTITNLARGDISADSTDAVNGSQIHDMGQSIAQGMGGNSTFVDGKLVTALVVGTATYDNVNDALGGLDGKVDQIGEVANAGWHVGVNGEPTQKVAPGDTVQFHAGDNIAISRAGTDLTVALANDIALNSVTARVITTNVVNIDNGPTIDQNGVDMNNTVISNLADGVAPQDAVNVRQLDRASSNFQGQVNRLDNRIDKVANRSDAGVAAALATAGLPQAYLPGKSMVSVAGGTWRGESGYALGVSTVSGGGSWLLKASMAGSSRGDYGGTVGVGYQW